MSSQLKLVSVEKLFPIPKARLLQLEQAEKQLAELLSKIPAEKPNFEPDQKEVITLGDSALNTVGGENSISQTTDPMANFSDLLQHIQNPTYQHRAKIILNALTKSQRLKVDLNSGSFYIDGCLAAGSNLCDCVLLLCKSIPYHLIKKPTQPLKMPSGLDGLLRVLSQTPISEQIINNHKEIRPLFCHYRQNPHLCAKKPVVGMNVWHHIN